MHSGHVAGSWLPNANGVRAPGYYYAATHCCPYTTTRPRRYWRWRRRGRRDRICTLWRLTCYCASLSGSVHHSVTIEVNASSIGSSAIEPWPSDPERDVVEHIRSHQGYVPHGAKLTAPSAACYRTRFYSGDDGCGSSASLGSGPHCGESHGHYRHCGKVLCARPEGARCAPGLCQSTPARPGWGPRRTTRPD